MTRRRLVALTLAGVLALAGFGCTGSTRTSSAGDAPDGTAAAGDQPGGAAPRRGGTLDVALLAPRSLDPAVAVRFEEQVLAGNLFDGLTTIDRDGAVRPAVAASWSSDPSMRLWRFQLRADARFSDGTPVRAEDFKFAWERLASPKVEPRLPAPVGLLGLIEGYQAFASGKANTIGGISVPDPGTLMVDLTEPFADLPAMLANPRLSPVPRDLVRRDPGRFAAEPVGNGPFMLTGQPGVGRSLELVPNPHHPGPPPHLDRVRVEVVPDELTAWLAFQHSLVRFAPVPSDQVAAAREIAGTSADGRSQSGLLQGPALSTWSFGFDLRAKPAIDPRWRRAVSLAIDRQRIATALAGAGVPASGIVPAGVPGAGQAACPSCGYDPAQARALLAQVGPAGGQGVVLTVPDTPLDRRVADMVAADLRKVGIRVAVKGTDPARYPAGPERPQGKPGSPPSLEPGSPPSQLFAVTWTADYPRMDAFLHDQFSRPGAGNFTGFGDATVERLLTQARATADEAARTRLYQQAEAAVLAQTPVAPVLEQRQSAVLAPGVEGFDLTPWGSIDLAAASLAN